MAARRNQRRSDSSWPVAGKALGWIVDAFGVADARAEALPPRTLRLVLAGKPTTERTRLRATLAVVEKLLPDDLLAAIVPAAETHDVRRAIAEGLYAQLRDWDTLFGTVGRAPERRALMTGIAAFLGGDSAAFLLGTLVGMFHLRPPAALESALATRRVFVECLRLLRPDRMSDEALAKRSGVHRNTVGGWMRGVEPQSGDLVALAGALVSPRALRLRDPPLAPVAAIKDRRPAEVVALLRLALAADRHHARLLRHVEVADAERWMRRHYESFRTMATHVAGLPAAAPWPLQTVARGPEFTRLFIAFGGALRLAKIRKRMPESLRPSALPMLEILGGLGLALRPGHLPVVAATSQLLASDRQGWDDELFRQVETALRLTEPGDASPFMDIYLELFRCHDAQSAQLIAARLAAAVRGLGVRERCVAAGLVYSHGLAGVALDILEPEATPAGRPELVSVWHQLVGAALLDLAKRETAGPYLERAAELDPQNGTAAYELARLHDHLGNARESNRWAGIADHLGYPYQRQPRGVTDQDPRPRSATTGTNRAKTRASSAPRTGRRVR